MDAPSAAEPGSQCAIMQHTATCWPPNPGDHRLNTRSNTNLIPRLASARAMAHWNKSLSSCIITETIIIIPQHQPNMSLDRRQQLRRRPSNNPHRCRIKVYPNNDSSAGSAGEYTLLHSWQRHVISSCDKGEWNFSDPCLAFSFSTMPLSLLTTLFNITNRLVYICLGPISQYGPACHITLRQWAMDG